MNLMKDVEEYICGYVYGFMLVNVVYYVFIYLKSWCSVVSWLWALKFSHFLCFKRRILQPLKLCMWMKMKVVVGGLWKMEAPRKVTFFKNNNGRRSKKSQHNPKIWNCQKQHIPEKENLWTREREKESLKH